MRNIKPFIFILLATIMLSSCESSKQMIIMRDMQAGKIIRQLPLKETEHILKTGDVLYVNIQTMNPDLNALLNPNQGIAGNAYTQQQYGNPTSAYLNGYEVDSAGYINLPMLGKVKVGGVPLPQVQSLVQKRANKFLKNPVVNVKMLNFKVTVMGEVNRQGVYYNPENTLTVLQAIALAGGSTNTSSIRNVVVIRSFPKGDKAYKLNLLSDKSYNSPGFYLQPNDYVIVHPNRNKNLQLNSQAFSLFFSSVSILISVLLFAGVKL